MLPLALLASGFLVVDYYSEHCVVLACSSWGVDHVAACKPTPVLAIPEYLIRILAQEQTVLFQEVHI